MVRSRIKSALGNENEAIEDAQKAAFFNPLDGSISRNLALLLCRRNERLGENASSNQIIEAKSALERAMAALAMGQNDEQYRQLLSFYAEYISSTDEMNALGIRQYLQKIAPTVQNALLLGRLAMKIALAEKTSEQQKRTLLSVAESSFEQARTMEPKNEAVLDSFAEYYRLTGQGLKAEEILKQSQDDKLLWMLYLRQEKLSQAADILERMYTNNPKDPDVVKGLLLVAEKRLDPNNVQKYSEELLQLEETVENRLFQIQSFLRIGLIKEAEYKLQALQEKYPQETRAKLVAARLAMRKGQLSEALELTNQYLQNNPDDAMGFRLRGEINFLRANYSQSITDFNKSKSISDDTATRLALARAYWRASRTDEAITELKNIIDRPQPPPQAGELLEQIYTQLGRKEELKKFYDDSIQKFPDNAHWYNRAAAFSVSEGQLARAEQLYSTALQKAGSSNAEAEVALDGFLQTFILEGKQDKVPEYAAKYVDGNLAPTAFIRMAEVQLKLGNRAQAVKYCYQAIDKAVAARPLLAGGVFEKVRLFIGSEEVEKYAAQRLQAEPDSLPANLIMFELAKLDGQYNKAIASIDKCLQMIKDEQSRFNYLLVRAMVLGKAYEKTSDSNYLARAVEGYESLLSKTPNNSGIMNNLAYILAQSNEKLADALKYASRAYEISPDSPDVADTYAYILYKKGEYRQAGQLLQAALQQYEALGMTPPSEVYEHLGLIKEKSGSKAEAISAYKQALETASDMSQKTRQRIEEAIRRLSD